MKKSLGVLVVGLFVAMLLTCSGCVSASGMLGDVQITVKSGFFTESDPWADWDGDEHDGAFNVTLASFASACNVYADYDDVDDMAESASDARDAWEAFFPEDFWVVYIHLVVEDTNSPQRGAVFDGVDWDEAEVRDGEYWAEIFHLTEHPDKDFFEGETFLDEYGDIFWSDGGDLQINSHTVDKSVGGKMTTDAVWMDGDEDPGDDAGTITVNFDVNTCVNIYY